MSATDRIRHAAAQLGDASAANRSEHLAALVERMEAALDPVTLEEGPDLAAGREQVRPGPELRRALGAVHSRATAVADGGAYVWLLDEDELRVAAGPPGPLRGWPFSVKDLIAVAGRRLGAGSRLYDAAPTETQDAPLVTRLRDAGAVLVGGTALHELAFGVTGINDHAGTPRNPHDPERITGGSTSGGAVSVAEGSARFAVGTDTGGSVRIPAALCGIVGFKPSSGRYPIGRVHPLAPTLDHVGLLTSNIADLRPIDAALARSPGRAEPALRFGLDADQAETADPDVATALEAAVRALSAAGLEVEEVALPDPERVFAVSSTIMYAEAAAIHAFHLAAGADRIGRDVLDRLVQGTALRAVEYLTALRERTALIAEVGRLLGEVDAVVGPTVGFTAPRIDDARDPARSAGLVANTRLGNVTGLPTASVPLPAEGLPIGMQLMTPDDARALAIIEQVTGVLDPDRPNGGASDSD